MTAITETEILEAVDEYSLFCFYLEFEPVIGNVYNSPIRIGDDVPSFGLYERTKSPHLYSTEYMWKDAALTYPNFGDIFDLICRLYELESRTQALFKIATDFGLADLVSVEKKKLILYEPVFKMPSEISIKSKAFSKRDLEYWAKYNVGIETLSEYNVTSVDVFWTSKDAKPFFPKQCYAYRIHNRYQLYQPFVEKKKKFINNWTELCIPGWAQLKGYDTLIITKAYKDVVCLSTLGDELRFDVIGPRGENILLPAKAIEVVSKRYKNIFTLMDNDGKTSADKYSFRKETVPEESGTKDPTDYMARYGVNETKILLKKFINDNNKKRLGV
jgi:hypothetical protein